jgi:hypothetical protein
MDDASIHRRVVTRHVERVVNRPSEAPGGAGDGQQQQDAGRARPFIVGVMRQRDAEKAQGRPP